LNFDNLENLRILCAEILGAQSTSLQYFASGSGFAHVRSKPKVSVSSTATCALSLVSTGAWKATPADTKKLLQYLVRQRTSAKLPDDNPFTTAWILEAVTALSPLSDPLDEPEVTEVARKEEVLRVAIAKSGGVGMPLENRGSENPAASESADSSTQDGADQNKSGDAAPVSTSPIGSEYPPSAYLTQLVVRALRRRNSLPKGLEDKVSEWAWSELPKQFALLQAGSKSRDPFSVAYLIMLVSSLTPRSSITPDQFSIRKIALESFFASQLPDGTWPLSRPLFHYPSFGNAYCYEYEMLSQLLEENELQDALLEFVPRLEQALRAVTVTNVYRLDDGVWAWNSGHHPHLPLPESWATAAVFHFVHEFDLLLAEAVRREVFRYLDLPRPTATYQVSSEKFAEDVLDSQLTVRSRTVSLKEYMSKEFVKPIANKAKAVVRGGNFGDSPRSAIFYGPPGTSKTELSKKIASFLGWPFLGLDPSVLLRHGMDGIQAEANTIFRMLEQTDAVVVLFDEFDELVRERGGRAEQPFSRLLTTSMLPKLARLHKRGKLVFIIATNNISEFDLAISRRGRFDKVIQIMPPTLEEKLTSPLLNIREFFDKLHVNVDDDIRRKLGELTFAETESFAAHLANAKNAQAAVAALTEQWNDSTMQRKVPKTQSRSEEEITWAERCRVEAGLSH
jgi:AAA+ superfamily predicted ATPase